MKEYDTITRHIYKLYDRFYLRRAYRQYLIYGLYLTNALLPKLSYQNNFEKPYIKPHVQHSGVIVLGMLAITGYLLEKKRAERGPQ